MHLLAIWPGPHEPVMRLLLQPLVREMRMLSLVGIPIYDCYKKVNRQLFASLLRTTADLPARAKVSLARKIYLQSFHAWD